MGSWTLPLLVALWATMGGAPPTAPPSDPIFVGAGDITSCGRDGGEKTAALLDRLFPPGTPLSAGLVFTTGDNAYDSGKPEEFAKCYEPSWGRHRVRTRPALGNHDYHTAGAAGYFGYFGAQAGDPARGYYSYDLGTWHIVVLNSNCKQVGGCEAGSPQLTWLRADLAAHPSKCALAYWHNPRFSSAVEHGDDATMTDLWQALMDRGVDVALVGHDHTYERFAPQTAQGAPDAAHGIREFVVGTGGRSHYRFGKPKPNSEVRDATSFGVLKLTLHASSYDWEFLPAAGGSFTDAGSAACH